MTHYLSMLVFGKYIGHISYILCQFLVCSGKSQLSNYANANYRTAGKFGRDFNLAVWRIVRTPSNLNSRQI